MRQLLIAALGIILLYAGISNRWEVFRRIRGIPLKGIAAVIMRIIYITAGILLIAITLAKRI